MATPGRAKQAKVKSASLVKALLTTHPQGEETWGSFPALRGPCFWPAFPGRAPAARASGAAPTCARPQPGLGLPPSLDPKFGNTFGVPFAACDSFRISRGGGESDETGGAGGRNTPHAPVLENGNKHFRRPFCKDLVYTVMINIVQVCSLFAP